MLKKQIFNYKSRPKTQQKPQKSYKKATSDNQQSIKKNNKIPSSQISTAAMQFSRRRRLRHGRRSCKAPLPTTLHQPHHASRSKRHLHTHTNTPLLLNGGRNNATTTRDHARYSLNSSLFFAFLLPLLTFLFLNHLSISFLFLFFGTENAPKQATCRKSHFSCICFTTSTSISTPLTPGLPRKEKNRSEFIINVVLQLRKTFSETAMQLVYGTFIQLDLGQSRCQGAHQWVDLALF